MKKFVLIVAVAALSIAGTAFAVATQFPDVSESDWFYPAVSYVSEHGLMTGYPNGNFGPTNAVNRAELATVLSRINANSVSQFEIELTALRDYDLAKLSGGNWEAYKQSYKRFPVSGIQQGPGEGGIFSDYESVKNQLTVVASDENGFLQVLANSEGNDYFYFFIRENSDFSGETNYGPFYDDVERIVVEANSNQ